jgi:heparan-alpha-glucosaminide N-acetyltransferase
MLTAINALSAKRIASIDAFRGMTFLLMIFVNSLHSVSGISSWLKHMPADADAMSLPDVVFPAFLFIVGMSIPFSLNARIAKGCSNAQLLGHILYRALSLVIIGVFMVNAEDGYNEAAMGISINAWSLLFYVAVVLIWGSFGFRNVLHLRALKVLGAFLLLALAAIYRSGLDGHGLMTPQWWGILGLIGWAYLVCCAAYLLARGNMAILLTMLVACTAYYAISHLVPLGPVMHGLFSQDAHAAHSSIVLTGTICTQIFFDTRRRDSSRRRFVEVGVLLLALLLAAYALRPYFGISKIYATPSWCLYSAAICVATFTLLYALIDLKKITHWTAVVEPAATNPLVTYLIPFVVESLLLLTGLALPAVLSRGYSGILWAATYAGLVVWLVARLNRLNFGIRL